MGARQSRKVNATEDPEMLHIQKIVMDYLQEFDERVSDNGRVNRIRRQIDLKTIQQLLDNEAVMRGLLEIIDNETSSLCLSETTESDRSFRKPGHGCSAAPGEIS